MQHSAKIFWCSNQTRGMLDICILGYVVLIVTFIHIEVKITPTSDAIFRLIRICII